MLPENIELSAPYLNRDGKLSSKLNIYSMAGADSYWNLIGLEDGSFDDFTRCDIDHEITS